MAKRRDQLIAAAVDRAAKAEILTLKSVKDFTVRIGDIERVREPGKNGRVIKQVQLLDCSCRVAGRLQPIEIQIPMEAGESFGVSGELEHVILPAVGQFVKEVIAIHLAGIREKDKPLKPPEIPPLPSDRPVTEAQRESGRRMHAARETKRKQASTPAPDQFGDTNGTDVQKGGEG